MASIIEGYNYDIFISYRQKDNKYDGWVTEFVDNLKKELEATFKEEISVYFDINPSDYLLETYDVDASLKDKLKCLVFIPIISRTYCDPKAFAWEYEFKAFVNLASQDKYGLKIKLPNGNVTNRVLPIRIHDLDNEDIKLCESILGGVLRGIEFIYKEPGVNRSLTPKDHEEKNLNNTNYRNQINKVALAIKEIIQGMKTEPVSLLKEKAEQEKSLEEVRKEEKMEMKKEPGKTAKRKMLTGSILIAILLIVAGVITYPKIFKRDSLERIRASGERISVAVMPFQNMTNDTAWNIWQDGIKDELIIFLTNYKELKVRQTESINNMIQNRGLSNYASITPSIASAISQKIDAEIFIYGSIKQVGTTIRINAQSIDSKTEEATKSFQIDGIPQDILLMTDSLSKLIKSYLIITDLEKELSSETPGLQKYISTNSPEAYRYYIYGSNAFLLKGDYSLARNWLQQAISIDSNFFMASQMLSFVYMHQGMWDQAKEWCMRDYKKREQMPILLRLLSNRSYAYYFETPDQEVKYWKQIIEMEDQTPHVYTELGYSYNDWQQFDKAIPEFEKALEIYEKWDSKPFWASAYTALGLAYHNTGQYKEEKRIYKSAEKDFPDSPYLLQRQAILSLSEGNTDEANKYIEKYKSIRNKASASEGAIASRIAEIYSEAGIPDEAEKYYREALSISPKSPYYINLLAYFLIDKDRNVNEGLELVDKALKSNPDDFNYLHTKGWGLYKQGKYQEALDILQKSWNLKPRYNHDIYQHLQAAKKAVAGQK